MFWDSADIAWNFRQQFIVPEIPSMYGVLLSRSALLSAVVSTQSKSMKSLLVIISFLIVCFLIALAQSQGPVFFHEHADRIGVAFTKGGYRSFWISFCDGYAFLDGEIKPVVLKKSADGVTYEHYFGHRIIPRFHHIDARPFTENQIDGSRFLTNKTVQP